MHTGGVPRVLNSMASGIDQKLINTLASAPMTAEAWAAALFEHQTFLSYVRPTANYAWQVLDFAGLPMAMWVGPTTERGKQLNLNLGNLTGLKVEGTNLEAAGLPGVKAPQVSFRSTNFRLALLTDAQLDGADFSNAKLEFTDFSRASLRGASFRNARIDNTDFENADLRDCDFTGASFNGPKLTGAKLDGAKGLTAELEGEK